MELISYRGIELEVVQTRDVRRDVIMSDDGVDYLWTDHYIDVIVTYNPGATNYAVDGDGVVRRGPGGRRGWLAGVTDTSIRHILSQPRGRLFIKAAGATILDTPREGEPCDANNGPSCKVISIQRITGDKTFTMHLQFKASVNECPPHQRQVMLSNRWKATEEVDAVHGSTRTINGTLVLNAGVAARSNVTADSLRNTLFLPVPDNYQRQNIRVEASSDGNRLTYSFQDQLQNFNLGPNSKAVKIELEPFAWYTTGTVGQMFAGAAAGTLQNVVGAMGQTSPRGLMTAFPSAAWNSAKSNLPMYQVGCTCKVTGNYYSEMADLSRLAMGTALGRISTIGRDPARDPIRVFGLGQATIDAYQNHTKRFAQITLTYRFGADSTFAQAVLPGDFGIQRFLKFIQDGPDVTIRDGYSNPRLRPAPPALTRERGQTTQNPPFPNDNGSRGSTFVRLVTQVLSTPCAPPAAPPQNRRFPPFPPPPPPTPPLRKNPPVDRK